MYDNYIRCVLNHWKNEMSEKFGGFYEELESLANAPCTIGLVGQQSAGKTTLLNACLGYPLFPSAATIGTACPVQIESGKEPGIAVCVKENGVLREIPAEVTSREQFLELLQYAVECLKRNVISIENLEYFSDKPVSEIIETDDLHLLPGNRRHGMILLLILLAAYVGQDREKAQWGLGEERRRLLKKLGIPGGQFCFLKVIWDCDLLKDGIRLLDLPGLGSSVQGNEEEQILSHDQIAFQFAGDCDILICLTSGEAQGGFLKKFAEDISLCRNKKKPPRFLAVVNRADKVINGRVTYHAVKEIFAGLPPVPVYFLSALSGEYRFLTDNMAIETTLYWKYDYVPCRMTMNDMYGTHMVCDGKEAVQKLRAAYEKKYEGYRATGERFSLSCKEFIEDAMQEAGRKLCKEQIRKIYEKNTRAALWLDGTIKGHIRYLTLREKNREQLLEYMKRYIGHDFEKYEAGLKAAAEELRGSINLFYEKRMQFFRTWQMVFDRLNREMADQLMGILDDTHAVFGYIPVVERSFGKEEGSVLGMNRAVLEAVPGLVTAYDFEHQFQSTFRIYQEAFEQVTEAYGSCRKQIYESDDEFSASVASFAFRIENYARDVGMDDAAYRNYFDGLFSLLGDTYQAYRGQKESFDTLASCAPPILSCDWEEMARSRMREFFHRAGTVGNAENFFRDDTKRGYMLLNRQKMKQLMQSGFFDTDVVISSIRHDWPTAEETGLLALLEDCIQALQRMENDAGHRKQCCLDKISSIWRQWNDDAEKKMQKNYRLLSYYQRNFHEIIRKENS